MKRRAVLGLRSGDLPACVDVNFTGFSGSPLFMRDIQVFSIGYRGIFFCIGDWDLSWVFEGWMLGCGWMRVVDVRNYVKKNLN